MTVIRHYLQGPDHTLAREGWDSDRFCMQEDDGYVCTLGKGHAGTLHVAGNEHYVEWLWHTVSLQDPYGFHVGDPDPTPDHLDEDEDEDAYCGITSPITGMDCTWPSDHASRIPHICGSLQEDIRDVWWGPGDPDPTSEVPVLSEWREAGKNNPASCSHSNGVFWCTLPKGHFGHHVGGTGKGIAAAWEQESLHISGKVITEVPLTPNNNILKS